MMEKQKAEQQAKMFQIQGEVARRKIYKQKAKVDNSN